MIRALVFDFDGLVLDTESPLIEAWVEMHVRAGLECKRADAIQLIGHVDIEYDAWTAFPAYHDRTTLDNEHRVLSRAILRRQPLLPGVRERLEEARQLGLQLAVASNSSHRHVDGHLQRLGLFEYFSAIRCRDDVSRGKPEPDVYQAVLTALGHTGAESIAFEDSHAGSLAAKRAGLWCVAVPNVCTTDHDFSHADLRIASLAEVRLADLIERWNT